MKKVLLTLTVALFMGVGLLFAEEVDALWNFKSEKAIAAKAKYDNGVKEVQRKYEEEMKTLKQTLIQELEVAAKEEGKAGNLDEAIKIRTAKERLMGTNTSEVAKSRSNSSDEVTADDIPLKFVLEKSVWDNDVKKTYIWGKVLNNGMVNYRSVKVVMTATDMNGKLLNRYTWHCEPSEIGKGQVSYIEEKFIETDKKPAKITFKVLGRPAD